MLNKKKTTEEKAWDLYCKETAGDMDVKDFWEELRPDIQQLYILKVTPMKPRSWKKYSISCGLSKEKCQYRDSKSPSKCSVFDDRNKCAKSRNNAKKNSISASKKARQQGVFIR